MKAAEVIKTMWNKITKLVTIYVNSSYTLHLLQSIPIQSRELEQIWENCTLLSGFVMCLVIIILKEMKKPINWKC